ncbi:hypothetical protein GOBAR_AA21939 [Gossypium barbadense]|uniref:Uncharacterized protein n=1 Tax=Gossypium barbadense TaxID=3634 RepID=A0A2P5X5W4_GOSBA|nr:hypothetical protein GOBAR_AA21939 [Gossypium barbadense]
MADPKDASTRYLPLYKAVDGGDLEATKKFLDQHPDALCSSLSTDGDTALHIAVLAGHVDIVEELVGRISALELAVKQKYGSTALNFAAIGGVTEIAELLVEKNRKLLEIPNDHEQIPLVVAALYGHRDLVQYLYLKTPIEELDPTSKNHGAILLTACIMDEFYIALDLVQRYPLLAIAEDTDKDTALHILAQKPSAFPSIHLDPQKASLIASGDIEMPHEGPPHRRSFTKRVLHRISEAFWKGLKLCVPGFTSIYELKLTHLQARELLTCICREVPNLEDEIKLEAVLRKALFEAVKQGIVEFVTEIMKHYPEVVWFYDDKDRNIFFVATAERQEKIFSLIYKMGAKKNSLATHWDKDFNNMLHQAAFLAPSSRLDRVSGAALQMQRELQWFKILTSRYREEDFLQTVPTKLMVGLSMMFFSLATMMITFGVALFIVLRDRIAWVSFPIILLASLPVTLFALLQFPLLVEIFISTYGPGIFDKPKKNLCPSGSTRSSTRCFR